MDAPHLAWLVEDFTSVVSRRPGVPGVRRMSMSAPLRMRQMSNALGRVKRIPERMKAPVQCGAVTQRRLGGVLGLHITPCSCWDS